MSTTDDKVLTTLERLYPPSDEAADWDDVLRRLERPSVSVVTRARRRRVRVPAVAGVLVTAAAVALLVTAPWRGGPSIIARASAAITVPNKVIFEQVGLSRFWVETGGGARHFRAIVRWVAVPGRPLWNPRGGPAGATVHIHNGQASISIEMGGTLGPQHVQQLFIYQAYSHTLLKYTQAPTGISSNSFDPVSLVRAALASGSAHIVGKSRVNGRPVIEIALDLTGTDNAKGRGTYYVDAHSYIPVKLVFHHTSFLTFPYVPAFDQSTKTVTITFSVFRYLPPTSANRALADIRARHPKTKIVCAQEFGLPDC